VIRRAYGLLSASFALDAFPFALAKIAFSTATRAVCLHLCGCTVDGGQRAVMFDKFRGVLPEVIGEGTHFRIPILQVSRRRHERMANSLRFGFSEFLTSVLPFCVCRTRR